ncbi:hypothetical protein BD324DRAFT_648473 [Kockovaella imperatae]|uniref:Uncharacterized protein n=1 Tax=Kockovaella imperatae TaxID=4999 RepID=A0A1Y1UP94_9TREE|nr:hypothetical protein BD324DRAFT_648473 [Kockovaella imperatae]ORX39853.1 hypothetical protein BD324DRAFT_648473 [Kockovaella imperatae]
MAPETSPKEGKTRTTVLNPPSTSPAQVHNNASKAGGPGSKKRDTASNSTSRPSATRRASEHKLSDAEQYANAHSKSHRDTNAGANKKPIFEWISRKLGKKHEGFPHHTNESTSSSSPRTGNSSTLPGITTTPRGRFVSLPVAHTEPPSPTRLFSPLSRDDSGRLTHSESVSLRRYPHSIADSERMRIREANNPYPSIPVPMPRDSTLDSQSMSFVSRSRTPSLRSETSTRPRISFADDSSQRWSGADEDASIRPFPPSHPASPAPSTSVISRSASASLLSPGAFGTYGASFRRSQYSATDSTNSSDVDRVDRSRRDSASTKPTTILSIDAEPPPAHIATVPPAPTSAPSPTPAPVAGPSSPLRRVEGPTSPLDDVPPSLDYVQAPRHSHPHPRDNPHPSSPPDPNASTLTLASSTFATGQLSPNPNQVPIPGPASVRLRDLSNPAARSSALATSPSVTFAPETSAMDRPPSMIDSNPPSTHALSLYGGMSMRTGRGVADGDASVRAVRRKGSWESNESRWSWRGARGQQVPGGGASTPGGSVLNPMMEGRVEGMGHDGRDSYGAFLDGPERRTSRDLARTIAVGSIAEDGMPEVDDIISTR